MGMTYLEAAYGTQATAWRDYFGEIYHQSLKRGQISIRLVECRKQVEKYIDENSANQLQSTDQAVKMAGAAALKEKVRQAERAELDWAFD